MPVLLCFVAHSGPTLCNPWTVARQAPLSMGFSRQEYRSVATSFSRGPSRPRNRTHVFYVSCIGRWILYLLSHWGSPPSSSCLEHSFPLLPGEHSAISPLGIASLMKRVTSAKVTFLPRAASSTDGPTRPTSPGYQASTQNSSEGPAQPQSILQAWLGFCHA